MPAPHPATPPRPRHGWSLLVSTLLCLLLMLWAGTDADHWGVGFDLTSPSADYYNLLVDGLLEGHLHMKVAPDAAGKLPYLMDASLYQGKYYLYFGIVPALLSFLPYSFLTGLDLHANLATLLYVAAGFLLNLRLYALARRRYFPTVTWPFEVGVTGLLAFGSATPILVFDGGMYEVALAGGYLCISGALLGLYQALHAERHATSWLALASLGAGLAVGCRPTYLPALAILLLPLLCPHVRGGQDGASPGLIRLAGAALIPAGLVGLALMAYNHGRFGDPFEFGFRYQVNALMDSGLPFSQLRFIPANLKWYYLTPPVLSPHFPYVLPIDASLRPADYYGYELIHGQWLVLPLIAITVTGLLGLKLRRLTVPSGLLLVAAGATVTFAAVFALLLTFGFRANRYVTDFQPSLILAVTLLGGHIAASSAAGGQWLGRTFRWLFCGCAALLAAFNYLVGIQWMNHLENTRPAVYTTLAYYGNYPSHWLHCWGWLDYGPCRLRLVYPENGSPALETLLATGTSGYNDTIYSLRHPGNQVQFVSAHAGYVSTYSDPVTIVPGIEHTLEVDLGALYPPAPHPYFRDWRQQDIDRAKHTRRLLLDGKEILHVPQKSYDAPPASLTLGRNPFDREAAFSGTISSFERISALPPRDSAAAGEFGVWRLEVKLPTHLIGIGQPLLSSGIAGRGNLLLIEILSEREFRFGLDEWGAGLTHSPGLTCNTAATHRIEVVVGPQVTRQSLRPEWELTASDLTPLAAELQVWLDDRLVWRTPIRANSHSYHAVGLGTNFQGFSTADSLFGGQLRNCPLRDDEKGALLHRSLQQLAAP